MKSPEQNQIRMKLPEQNNKHLVDMYKGKVTELNKETKACVGIRSK